MKYRTFPLSLAVALVGCPAPSEQPAPAKDEAGKAVAKAAAAETPAAEPTTPAKTPTNPAAAEPEPGSAESPDAEAPPPPATDTGPTTALHVVAKSETTMMLHPLADDALLVSVGPLVLRVDERGELVHDPKMLRGIHSVRGISPEGDDFYGVSAWWPVAIGGRWPEAVYMSLDLESGFRGEGGIPEVYRWDTQAWASLAARGPRYRWYPAEVHPWINGSLLARRVFNAQPAKGEEWDPEQGPTDKQLEAATKAIDKAKSLVVIRGAPKAPAVSGRVRTFTSRPTGEVFVVDGATPPNLLRIDADGSQHKVALPGERASVRGVISTGPKSAWVFGVESTADAERPWLVQVEGDEAKAADAPPCTQFGLASFAVLDTGTQWATCGTSVEDPMIFEVEGFGLWHRPAKGAWARFTLPKGVDAPRRVVARSEGDVWVVADGGHGAKVLHSRPRTKVLELPDLPTIGRQVVEWNEPLPVDSSCSFPYLPLRSPSSTAEAVKTSLDGPMKALKLDHGVFLVRTTLREREQLGLQVMPPFEEEQVGRILAAVRKALGKEVVEAPRCWYADEAEKAPLASWGEP